jgi:hypothetical protein
VRTEDGSAPGAFHDQVVTLNIGDEALLSVEPQHLTHREYSSVRDRDNII